MVLCALLSGDRDDWRSGGPLELLQPRRLSNPNSQQTPPFQVGTPPCKGKHESGVTTPLLVVRGVQTCSAHRGPRTFYLERGFRALRKALASPAWASSANRGSIFPRAIKTAAHPRSVVENWSKALDEDHSLKLLDTT